MKTKHPVCVAIRMAVAQHIRVGFAIVLKEDGGTGTNMNCQSSSVITLGIRSSSITTQRSNDALGALLNSEKEELINLIKIQTFQIFDFGQWN